MSLTKLKKEVLEVKRGDAALVTAKVCAELHIHPFFDEGSPAKEKWDAVFRNAELKAEDTLVVYTKGKTVSGKFVPPPILFQLHAAVKAAKIKLGDTYEIHMRLGETNEVDIVNARTGKVYAKAVHAKNPCIAVIAAMLDALAK